MTRFIANLRSNESGATAIEYALIAAGIAVAIIVAVGLLGDGLNSTFQSITTALGGGNP